MSIKLRRYAVSTAMVVVVGLLAPLGTQAEEQNGLELLTGTDTPLREKERISFIGDSLTMQGGFIRLMREAIGRSDPTKDLGIQLFQHGLSGGRVDTIMGGVTPWGKQDPFSTLLETEQPTVVVIPLGVNDVTHGDAISPEAFEKGLGKLVSEAKLTGATVILATPAVAGEKHDGTNPHDAKMDQYAAISRKVAAAHQVALCDLRTAFIDDRSQPTKASVSLMARLRHHLRLRLRPRLWVKHSNGITDQNGMMQHIALFAVLFGSLSTRAGEPARPNDSLISAVASGATAIQDEVSVMSSQLGYDMGDPMRVIVRCGQRNSIPATAKFTVLDSRETRVVEGPLKYWGEKWGSHWWIADFSGLAQAGHYGLRVLDGTNVLCPSDPFEVGSSILWDKTYPVIAYDYLKTRAKQARTGKGWKDCGSDLQEFSSHAVCVDGICDVLKSVSPTATAEQREFLLNQLIRGCDYMAHLQDKAEALGLGHGAVIHEDRDQDIVTGNVAKGAAILARVSRTIAEHSPAKSDEFLQRAKRAFTWIEQNGPIVPPGSQKFFPFVHGAPAGSVPPQGQWMTRDLVTMTRASIELVRNGETDYQAKAIDYANRVMKRQLSKEQAEDGLFGHFYTYDDFSSFGDITFTEKANIHCGAWSQDGRVYNKGGHYPHYLLPLIDMLELWPEHPDAPRWKRCLYDFAYGYLVPACHRSPFLILPAGYYNGEGLMYFGSWYHAHNSMYAFTATLALEFGKIFGDQQFRDIAVGNIQWIAGLNCGLREGEPARHVPASMVYGVGARSRGSWSKIPGSVCNGFSASQQFRIAAITAEDDKPVSFDKEAYIAHSLPYLAALARLQVYRARSTNTESSPLGRFQHR